MNSFFDLMHSFPEAVDACSNYLNLNWKDIFQATQNELQISEKTISNFNDDSHFRSTSFIQTFHDAATLEFENGDFERKARYETDSLLLKKPSLALSELAILVHYVKVKEIMFANPSFEILLFSNEIYVTELNRIIAIALYKNLEYVFQLKVSF